MLGGGTVINPVNLLREIDELRALGVEITPERLIISTRAHIISPAHIALDKASEKALGEGKIGTTLRGIGPAYMDKTGRSGIAHRADARRRKHSPMRSMPRSKPPMPD